MRPIEDGPPPTEDARRRVEELLAGEPALAWRPELTRAVLKRVRRRRSRERLWLAAAVLLIAAVTVGGAAVVSSEPVVSEATGWIAERVPSPPPLSTVLDSITSSVGSLAGGAEGAAAGLPLAIAALVLFVALNGAVVARPLTVRRKSR